MKKSRKRRKLEEKWKPGNLTRHLTFANVLTFSFLFAISSLFSFKRQSFLTAESKVSFFHSPFTLHALPSSLRINPSEYFTQRMNLIFIKRLSEQKIFLLFLLSSFTVVACVVNDDAVCCHSLFYYFFLYTTLSDHCWCYQYSKGKSQWNEWKKLMEIYFQLRSEKQKV